MSYALQSPSREMLYIVTTDAIKFKAKSWIDVFGGHAAKALGSGVNHSCKHNFGDPNPNPNPNPSPRPHPTPNLTLTPNSTLT